MSTNAFFNIHTTDTNKDFSNKSIVPSKSTSRSANIKPSTPTAKSISTKSSTIRSQDSVNATIVLQSAQSPNELAKPIEKVHVLDQITTLLERDAIAKEIKTILQSFDKDCMNVNYKKGIYIYGSSGSGKTHFVVELLKSLNYDVIKYDAGDVRNKTLVDTITSNNISNRNVLSMMRGQVKKIAIVMDEIDGMNNGDKGGISALIKIIRQKKTKKQKLENYTMNPIICIGNYAVDKKIKELIKVCHVFELKTPNPVQMSKLLDTLIPTQNLTIPKEDVINYIQGDMRKMMFVVDLYKKKPYLLTKDTLHHIFQYKSFNEDAKKITASLINNPVPFDKHNIVMNDTDRTIVALLWHENIADVLNKLPVQDGFPFYAKLLDNICFADYIDRITFQNQIWIFNEMSSLIKTFYNNHLYHERYPHNQCDQIPANRKTVQTSDIRFTKVLTKYSTEYNNSLYIYNMCQELNMDKKDLIAFFQELRLWFNNMIIQDQEEGAKPVADFMLDPECASEIEVMFENYSINKLDIRRMYRYLDKNVKKDAVTSMDMNDGMDDALDEE